MTSRCYDAHIFCSKNRRMLAMASFVRILLSKFFDSRKRLNNVKGSKKEGKDRKRRVFIFNK